MGHKESILDLAQANQGIVTSSQVTAASIPRRCLSEAVKDGLLQRVDRGIYSLPKIWEDEMFLIQYRFGKGIYSHETALYLHGFSDRAPAAFTLTFPHGYHAASIKKLHIIARYATLDIYSLGINEVISPFGNKLQTYDIERSLCDMVRGSNALDIQIVNQAMKSYAKLKTKNINKLMEYAEKLRVKTKILTYMEILL